MAPPSWVLAAASLLFGQALAQCQGTSPTPRWNIQMESGYKSKLLLTGLSTPRGVDFDRQGNLLIVERGRGISYVKLTEAADGSVCVQEKKLLINDAQVNRENETKGDKRRNKKKRQTDKMKNSSTTASPCRPTATCFTYPALRMCTSTYTTV